MAYCHHETILKIACSNCERLKKAIKESGAENIVFENEIWPYRMDFDHIDTAKFVAQFAVKLQVLVIQQKHLQFSYTSIMEM